MSLILAADFGGSNSRVIIGSETLPPGHSEPTLEILGSATFNRTGNLQKIKREGVSNLLRDFLNHLNTKPEKIDRALIACAGNDHPNHAKELLAGVLEAGFRESADIHPVNDVFFLAMAAAAINPKEYAHMISGTGACFLLAGNGMRIRVGGTWFLFEDSECGGFGIGRKLFTIALRDLQQAQSTFPEKSDSERVVFSSSQILKSVAAYVESKFPGESLDLILQTYGSVYGEHVNSNAERVDFLADAAPLAYNLALEGDERCITLLTKIGANIYEAIESAIEETQFRSGAMILTGSVFEKNHFVRETFLDDLRQKNINPQIVVYDNEVDRQKAALRGFQLSTR